MNLACKECGSAEVVHGTWTSTIRDQGQKETYHWRGQQCDDCGAGQPDKQEVDNNPALRMAANEFQAIRTELGLSIDEASEIFCSGEVGYASYECAEALPSTLIIKVLRLLQKRPELLEEYRSA